MFDRSKIGTSEVTVAVTPNGYADAVNGDYFVLPEERIHSFNQFLDVLENAENYNGIHYVQKQNSNLCIEFETLIGDVERDIPWATQALGKEPDAVNFWMGDERAVTSLHKDPYENLYAVVRGCKEFTLLPPTDLPWIPHEKFKTAQYKLLNGKYVIIPDVNETQVSWIPLDPLRPNYIKYPQYRKASPVQCTVRTGDILYLPSLWFHHVQQSNQCIAVNFWYDMEFDFKYCYYKFLEKLNMNDVCKPSQ
ncbi:JMJD7 (predicted) [Pycnogonum litorale]